MNWRTHERMQRYPHIFGFHARHLSIAECGAALSLAIYYGQHGRLPKSDPELAEIVGISTEEFCNLAGDRARPHGLMRTVKGTIIPLMYGEECK